jgi:hypothetical protein
LSGGTRTRAHLSGLAALIRRQEERVAGLERARSALEVAELNLRREYLGLLRRILEGWRVYRTAALAALELVPAYLAHGWVPTLYFRLLDRASEALLDSAHLAASYACRRAGELFGEEGRELRGALCFTGFMATVEKVSHEKGPIRYVLRAREERNRRLLEEGASTLEKQLIERGIL